MAKEIERKFLLAGEAWRAGVSAALSIVQFYLAAGEDRTVRVRVRNGDTALLTLKFGADTRERDEFEYEIPVADALEMRGFAVGHVIEKTRHLVPHKGLVFEVDEFHGALGGFLLAELETPLAVPEAALPPWLGLEVTGDQRYTNAALALAGSPPLP